ncbi:MAG: isoprenylcysteine carboxylmethyltransferase family protein [Vicinamibacterales bacterium]
MKLLDHFTRSGDLFFRWRSYLPLLLLPAFFLAAAAPPEDWSKTAETAWELACFGIALGGLAIRAWTVGTAPAGTSERSTREARAASLNTTGPYSVVRHPLYLGSSVVAFGLSLFPAEWYLPVIVMMAGLLYHERIAAREEAFLEERFGDEFRSWAERVPAMVPAIGRYRAPGMKFMWGNVIGREFHGLSAAGAGFFALDTVQESSRSGSFAVSRLWAMVFAVTAGLFVLMVVLKRVFGFFRTRTV